MNTLPLDIITRYPNIGDPKHKLNLSNVFFQKFVYEWFRFPTRHKIQVITNDVTERCFSFGSYKVLVKTHKCKVHCNNVSSLWVIG